MWSAISRRPVSLDQRGVQSMPCREAIATRPEARCFLDILYID